MARLGEDCLIDPDRPGPALLRLEWHLHPYHTPEWFAGQKARSASNADPMEFEREYEINYFSQRGSLVYPLYSNVNTGNYPYDPMGGPIMVWIDPGISDPGAIVWAQQDYGRGGWNVIESFEGLGGEDAHFYASVLTGVYVSGEHQYDYNAYQRLHEIMEFSASIRQPITYIGDPAGNQRGGRGDDKSTWYFELGVGAARIAPNRKIFVNTITADNARSHMVRQDAVRNLMPMFRFDHGPGGARVLHCLRVSRFHRSASGRSQIEATKPEHGPESHIRTCVEYGAVWIRRMVMPQQMRSGEVRKPIRVSSAGNVVSGRQHELFNRKRKNIGLGPI
jgi:hypothetical protein